MTQEEKQLLLKDLCERLPYGVKVCARFNTGNRYTANVCAIAADRDYIQIRENDLHSYTGSSVEDIRPYLRPTSSMTEEEQRTLDSMCNGVEMVSRLSGLKMFDKAFDWLNAHHFDYRGLIPMGLALEALEGMYKTE